VTPAARIAAAIDLLAAIETDSARPADAVANEFFRARRYIGSGDRRAVSDRVWRVLRARRRLQWWLQAHPATPRLLVGASLLLEGWAMDALSQACSGGRFAPAALTAAEKACLAPIEGHTLDHPAMPDAVRLEIPDWLLSHMRARFGPDLAREMAAMAGPAPLDLRVNLLKTTRQAAQAALRAEGWTAKPTAWSPWGLRIADRRPVTAGSTFQSGLVEIQDEGSQLIALLVDARPGMRVVDWCAGAGGKTLAIAAAMQNRGQVVACDVSAPRLDGAVRRLRRAGVHNVERHLIAAGDKWVKRRAGSFDRVLVDAPCTGTGTWRRNPDARLRLRPEDLAELRVKQAEILDIAQTLVRKGGRLVYATCSLLAEENEAQVSGFLERHSDFAVVPLARSWPLDTPPPCAGDFLSLTPADHGTDGFFAAVLERAA
jgi:16S rRNA (cytosine967-C5)-methyltransferase